LKAFGSEYALDRRWGRFQRRYIQVFGIVDLPTRIRARAVSRVLQEYPCKHFLDYGAGTGVYSFFLTRDPSCVGHAIDVDAERINSINRQALQLGRTSLNAVQANEDALRELPTSTFSTVLAIEVLMCVTDPAKVLTDLKERLQPGGIIIAHVPVRTSARPYERTLFTDTKLLELFEFAGFSEIVIRQTFGPGAVALCDVFAALTRNPLILAFLYPWLLVGAALTRRFVQKGNSRLIFARRPTEDQLTAAQ
jgi:SAM-dependent methyltransferase